MSIHVYEVYWETATSKGVRCYSRTFPYELKAVPFFATKKNNPATVRAFVREWEPVTNDRGRVVELRTVNIICTHNCNFGINFQIL